MILIRRPWTRQPQGAVGLARTALTENVIFCLPLNNTSTEIVRRSKLTLTATGGYGVDETGYSLRGSDTASCASIPVNLSDYSAIAVSFWLYWTAYASNDDMAMEFTANINSTQGGFHIDPNAGSSFSIASRVNSTFAHTTIVRPSAAAWHHYLINLRFGGNNGGVDSVYVDGLPVTATIVISGAGILNGNYADSTLYLFSRNNASLFGDGRMRNLVIRRNAASEAVAREEFQHPYALFQPRTIPIPLAAAAGGGLPTLTGITLSNLGTTSFTDTIAGA